MNELAEGLIYNTGIYVDANRGLLGKYRKVHLAVGERWRGITPGDEFPVWDTSYGRVGMLICYDNVMGEGHRILSQKGAEIVFMPIMGDPRAVGDQAPVVGIPVAGGLGDVGHIELEVAVVIEVGHLDTHGSDRVSADAGIDGAFLEGAIALVHEEQVPRLVRAVAEVGLEQVVIRCEPALVADIEIREAIARQIRE